MSQVDVGVADEPERKPLSASAEADALIKALPKMVDEFNQAAQAERRIGALVIGVDSEAIKLLVAEIRALGDEVRAMRAELAAERAASLAAADGRRKSAAVLDRVIDVRAGWLSSPPDVAPK